MKKFSKKGVLLFIAAMALCAFMMPSMAGAVTWAPASTNQIVTSPDVGFTSTQPVLGRIVSSCTDSSFNVAVGAASPNLEVTSTLFGGHCTATFPDIVGASCTTAATGTTFPWTITALSTSSIRLDNVRIDVSFIQTAGGTCPEALTTNPILITGSTTSGGRWDPTRDELILTDAEGLVSHSVVTGTNPVTARGTFKDRVGPGLLDLAD